MKNSDHMFLLNLEMQLLYSCWFSWLLNIDNIFFVEITQSQILLKKVEVM